MSSHNRVLRALQGIIEIGKRDLSNPKYDPFFEEAKAALQAAATAHPSRGVVDEIDPNSRNFKQGMAVGRAELEIVRKAIDSRQCEECGARNAEEARTMCRPDGDSCPGTEWPLADLWELQAAQPAAPSVPEDWVMVSREIVDRFPEINISNYDHDDACALNAWGVELVLAATPAHDQPEGEG